LVPVLSSVKLEIGTLLPLRIVGSLENYRLLALGDGFKIIANIERRHRVLVAARVLCVTGLKMNVTLQPVISVEEFSICPINDVQCYTIVAVLMCD